MKITIRDNDIFIDDNNDLKNPDFTLTATDSFVIVPKDNLPRYNAFARDYFNSEYEALAYLASCYSEKDTKMSYEEWSKDLMVTIGDKPDNRVLAFFENHPKREFKYSHKERLIILNNVTGIEAG